MPVGETRATQCGQARVYPLRRLQLVVVVSPVHLHRIHLMDAARVVYFLGKVRTFSHQNGHLSILSALGIFRAASFFHTRSDSHTVSYMASGSPSTSLVLYVAYVRVCRDGLVLSYVPGSKTETLGRVDPRETCWNFPFIHENLHPTRVMCQHLNEADARSWCGWHGWYRARSEAV